MRNWVLLALLLFACDDDSRSRAPLLNRCTTQFDCTQGTCELDLGICVQRGAELPYDYRVQITPKADADAGPRSAARTERATLGDAGTIGTITVANAVAVTGSVRSADDAPFEAELVFVPRGDALSPTASTFTRPGANGQAYGLLLEPGRTYDVQVYPRGPDSLRFPPYAFVHTTSTEPEVATFVYPAMVALSGQIRDENELPAPRGARIKTRYRDRLLASSSIGNIGDAGVFEVQLPQSVLDTPAEHELALDLSDVTVPQNVQIAFDMAQAPARGQWLMPTLPRPVSLTGTVEVAALANDSINAQLTFLSDFPIPTGDNDKADADWCQLRRPGAAKGTFRCSANVANYIDPERRYDVLLLPGAYRILIAPLGAALPVQRLALGTETETVQRQLNGMPQGPTALQLDPVTLFDITVNSGPSGRPMPSVLVSATALRLQLDLPEVALYNRTDSARTEYNGKSEVAVDTGVYDLIAAPPEGSGFAWVLGYNRRIVRAVLPPGKVDRRAYTLEPQLPVVLSGTALGASGAKIVDADVDAYAMVPDLAGGPDRAVRIAHTTTDRDGKFYLQMPPRIGIDDPDDDAGVSDAGADAQR